MNLTDIIPLNNIYLDVNVSSKKALFKEVAAKISNKLNIDQNNLFEKLNEREKLGSTGIGNGIAIPHGKVNGIKKVFSLFLRTKSLIDFSSSDLMGVDIIFVIIAPEESKTDHLLALSEISKFLRKNKNKEALRMLKTNHEVFELLSQSNED
jgi:PTS system nitrogen regulatory IIA component